MARVYTSRALTLGPARRIPAADERSGRALPLRLTVESGRRVPAQPAGGPLSQSFGLGPCRGSRRLRNGPTAPLVVAQGLDHLVEEVVDLALVLPVSELRWCEALVRDVSRGQHATILRLAVHHFAGLNYSFLRPLLQFFPSG